MKWERNVRPEGKHKSIFLQNYIKIRYIYIYIYINYNDLHHPAGTSVISVLFEAFYNDDL